MSLKRYTITIIIEGACLSEVFSTDENVDVILVDKDAIDGDEEQFNKEILSALESDINSGKVFDIY